MVQIPPPGPLPYTNLLHRGRGSCEIALNGHEYAVRRFSGVLIGQMCWLAHRTHLFVECEYDPLEIWTSKADQPIQLEHDSGNLDAATCYEFTMPYRVVCRL